MPTGLNSALASFPHSAAQSEWPNSLGSLGKSAPKLNASGKCRERIQLNYIYVNVANLTGLDGQTISLDINTTPEPQTLLLMATGLLASLAVGRKLFAS